jgi:hypothetical protein
MFANVDVKDRAASRSPQALRHSRRIARYGDLAPQVAARPSGRSIDRNQQHHDSARFCLIVFRG